MKASLILIGISSYGKDENFFWSDGSKKSFTNWEIGYPILNGDLCTVVTQQGDWWNIPCTREFYPVCKKWGMDAYYRDEEPKRSKSKNGSTLLGIATKFVSLLSLALILA